MKAYNILHVIEKCEGKRFKQTNLIKEGSIYFIRTYSHQLMDTSNIVYNGLHLESDLYYTREEVKEICKIRNGEI